MLNSGQKEQDTEGTRYYNFILQVSSLPLRESEGISLSQPKQGWIFFNIKILWLIQTILNNDESY